MITFHLVDSEEREGGRRSGRRGIGVVREKGILLKKERRKMRGRSGNGVGESIGEKRICLFEGERRGRGR